MTCEIHNEDQVWLEVRPGRRVLRCPSCHAGVRSPGQVALAFPKIKFSSSWGRERPWTEKERSTEFGMKPRKLT